MSTLVKTHDLVYQPRLEISRHARQRPFAMRNDRHRLRMLSLMVVLFLATGEKLFQIVRRARDIGHFIHTRSSSRKDAC